jgi:L-lysine 2,3-aminomutase
LETSQLQPTEEPDEWQDDQAAAAMAAAHELINRGETEAETRKRMLKARNCFMEAIALYLQSLHKWKDPRTSVRAFFDVAASLARC